MPFNAKVKGGFVYVFDKEVKDKLVQKGFTPLHKLNAKQDAWVFVRTEDILGHLTFDKKTKENFATSNKLTF